MLVLHLTICSAVTSLHKRTGSGRVVVDRKAD